MRKQFKQLGQGMTEYIIIVALIAIAAIAVYSFFGDTLRSQTSAMTKELAGTDGTAQTANAIKQAAKTDAETAHKGLDKFAGSSKKN